MLILYINYIDMDSVTSGSKVRPVKMYQAFLDEGHEVKLLTGAQSIAERKKRRAAVAEVRRWLDTNRPDICYIESPPYPILLRCDVALIRKIHRMGIPVGYFYRDFYRKFPELYPRRKDFVGGLKELWLDILQRRTDNALKCVDVVYFPSAECAEYFAYRDMRPLPPAGENALTERHPEEKTAIYVGGLEEGYGVGMLLDAFACLNHEVNSYTLLLVCRKAEWDTFESPWKSAPWLEVHHASGAGLEPLYDRAAVSVIPVRPTAYTHFAVNVKLFDYLGHGLPVVVTETRAISAIVRENGIGLVTPYETEAMANALQSVMNNPEERKELEKRCAEALKNGNLWVHRVRRIVSDLEEKR